MNRIRDARLAKGLTMKELGKRVGCTEAAISNYELGKRQANYELMLKMAEALDVSVSYLLNEELDEKLQRLEDAYQNYLRVQSNLTAEKQKLMDLIDDMSPDDLQRLLRIAEAIKG